MYVTKTVFKNFVVYKIMCKESPHTVICQCNLPSYLFYVRLQYFIYVFTYSTQN